MVKIFAALLHTCALLIVIPPDEAENRIVFAMSQMMTLLMLSCT
jgi:hypothetical protein